MTFKDVYTKGALQDLLPGDPICSPIRTVLAEASVSLVRRLSLHSLWKDHIVSAILKGLLEVRSTLLLSPEKKDVSKDSFKINTCNEDDNEDDTQVRQNRHWYNIQ